MAKAIVLYRDKGVDFIDTYNACWMRDREISDLYTFDKKHYRRLEGIKIYVPTEERFDE